MKNFVTCKLHLALLGWSNPRRWNGRSM